MQESYFNDYKSWSDIKENNVFSVPENLCKRLVEFINEWTLIPTEIQEAIFLGGHFARILSPIKLLACASVGSNPVTATLCP